ncbi:hypothetical protein JL107_03865 [Nakamurella flavida]|uniref:Uncharacterized protein n=1 Tax=Nakamurella flavida TaxID=363630 RepID=A0A939C213_9ACTN|nr:hypothetical protein [Nakamurella flavida]MBM9475576.1 hypothetical protein [Nakamurella flavida]MDP9778148.1 hypothetical protein [Nakamurella flavida]
MPPGQESPEEHERRREQMRRFQVPTNEVGAQVPFDPVVMSSPDAAVLLEGITVFSTGVVLRLRRVLRVIPPGADPRGRPGHPGEQLMVGVTVADGRTASSLGGRPHGGLPGPDEMVLQPQQGGGGGRIWSQQLLLTPVPPDGPVTLVVADPSAGIPETTVQLDGATLQDAIGRIQVLWPREPDDDHPPVPPRRPDLPPGGWFERNAGPPG